MAAFAVTFALGATAVAVWLTQPADYTLTLRRPESPPPGKTGQGVPETVEGKLERFPDVKAPAIRGRWEGFRGPGRENISGDMTELARTWPAGGPKVLWAIKVGEGHAGCAVLDGRIFLHDYDAKRRREVIRCMSLADAKDLWRYGYRMPIKRTHGYSRTVPTVTDEHLVTMGPKCHVTCLDSNTGEFRWDRSLVNDYGTVIPQWYSSQCPVIDDGNAIFAPCGNVTEEQDDNGQILRKGRSVLMTAIRCDTGKVLWEVPNDDGWQMTHSSIAVMELPDYTRLAVYCGSGGVVGVRTSDGRVLWKTTAWTVDFATVPMPVPVGENRIFLSGGYGSGCMMLEVAKDGDGYAARPLWRRGPDVFGSAQQTPIFYKSHLFGTRADGRFVCISARGEGIWESQGTHRFGKDGGPYLIADDLIFAMDDEGVLTLMEATPKAYRQLAQQKILPGLHSWAPMALVAGRLLARDETLLVCLDVSKQKD